MPRKSHVVKYGQKFGDLLSNFDIPGPSVYNRMAKGMSREEAIKDAYFSPQRGKMKIRTTT